MFINSGCSWKNGIFTNKIDCNPKINTTPRDVPHNDLEPPTITAPKMFNDIDNAKNDDEDVEIEDYSNYQPTEQKDDDSDADDSQDQLVDEDKLYK